MQMPDHDLLTTYSLGFFLCVCVCAVGFGEEANECITPELKPQTLTRAYQNINTILYYKTPRQQVVGLNI